MIIQALVSYVCFLSNCNQLTIFFLHLILVTVDVKRNIYDLSVNKYGSQIAIVENQGGYESLQESVVRIYCVGRKKNMEDEAVRKQFNIFRFKVIFFFYFQEEEDNEMEVSDDNSLSDNDSAVSTYIIEI